MNGFGKHISAFMVVWMLALQLLLAHHYTVHFSGEGRPVIQQQASGHDHPQDGHHDGAGVDDLCQICAFSKALSQVLGTAVFILLPILFALQAFTARFAAYPSGSHQPYSARAPPALS